MPPSPAEATLPHGKSPAHATVLVGALFLGGLASGAWSGASAAARAHDPYRDLDLFVQVLSVIESDYVEPVTSGELIEAAIRGMVGHLDDHSRWLSAQEYADLHQETAGHYEGIGVEVSREAGGPVTVTKVMPGSPAGRDGVLPGDRLVAVDGDSVGALELPDVAQRLKGTRGEGVTLTILRDGAPLEIRTVRDTVQVPSAEGGLAAPGIGYVRLVQFQHGAASDLTVALDRMESSGPLTGLVLDLRDNPGGLLDEAVAVVDLFIDSGVVVTTRGRVEGVEERAATPGSRTELPIAVLVNGGSASASEIVAGALRDHGRARLVGAPTFGKGTVQTVYENSDMSALKLTIGAYYTPSGQPVTAGLAPDVLIAPTEPDPTFVALRARLTALEVDPAERLEILDLLDRLPHPEPEPTEVPWHLGLQDRIAADPQLRKAIEILSE